MASAKSLFPGLVALLVLMAPGGVFAANIVTLEIPGIPGDSTLNVAKGQIDIQSFSFGATESASAANGSGATAGKPTISNLSVSKLEDRSTVPLFAHLLKGTVIPAAVLTFWSSSPKGTLTATYKIGLKNVTVTGQQQGGTTGGGEIAESVSFAFSDIAILDIIGGGNDSVEYNVATGTVTGTGTGGKGSTGSSFNWDITNLNALTAGN